MTRHHKVFFLMVLSAALIASSYAEAEIVPAGTLLQCTISEPNFSSKTANVGDPVLCHLGPVATFGHSLFPRGAQLGGHLEDYKSPGHFFGKGWMRVEFDHIILPDSQVLPVSAKIVSAPHLKIDKQGDIHGKGHPKRDAVEWMIPVLWPVKVLTLPARGPYPAFKGETRISLRVMEDIEMPFPSRNIPVVPSRYNSDGYSGSMQLSPAGSQAVTLVPATYRRSEPPPSSPSTEVTIIALKRGAAFLAQQYWVENGDQMRCISSTGEEKVLPLDELDLEQTVRVNQERNVKFIVQSRDMIREE